MPTPMTKDNTMPRDDELLKLAEKCEQATGPDRELDAEIAAELGWKEASALFWHDGYQARELPRFTRSIDAALALYLRVPERVPSNPRLAAAEALRQRAEEA